MTEPFVLYKSEKGTLNSFHLHSPRQYDHIVSHHPRPYVKICRQTTLTELKKSVPTSLSTDVVAAGGARELKSSVSWPTSVAILRSSIPCLLFFFIYGMEKNVITLILYSITRNRLSLFLQQLIYI